MRWMPAVIIAVVVVRGSAEYMAAYSINWVGNKLVMDLREAMFSKLLGLPTPYYDDHASGNLISEAHLRRDASHRRRHQRTDRDVQGLGVARRPAGLYAVAQLETDLAGARHDAVDRRRRAPDQRAPAQQQPLGAAGDGRCDAGAAGNDRRPQGGEALRRPALRGRALRRAGQPRAPFHDEADDCRRRERADCAIAGRPRARRDRLSRDAAIERQRDHRRRIRVVHHRHAHADRAAEAHHGRQRAAAARTRRRGECIRPHRPAGESDPGRCGDRARRRRDLASTT